MRLGEKQFDLEIRRGEREKAYDWGEIKWKERIKCNLAESCATNAHIDRTDARVATRFRENLFGCNARAAKSAKSIDVADRKSDIRIAAHAQNCRVSDTI